MKILNARVHGYIDFLMVLAFFLAPATFGFAGTAATACYALGAAYLGLVLLTAYPFGLIRLVPFPAHGAVEFLLAIVLMAMPSVLGLADNSSGFFVGSGIALFLVWLTTDYGSAAPQAAYPRAAGAAPARRSEETAAKK